MSILPVKKSVPETDLKKYLILIYGRPKIGKTTLAAQFEDPLFLCFEPGAKSLALYKQDISDWSDFREVVSALKKEDRFQTVIIDTLGPAYDRCLTWVSKQNGVEHPSELAYGKGWNAVETEFNEQINKIAATGRGIVLISHSDDKDIEQWDGTMKSMIAPDLPKQAMRFVDRSVDLIAYYNYREDGQRYIRVKATEEIMAGNRIEGHFEGISRFWAGNSAKEAYQQFLLAFNNKLVKENENAKTSRKAANGQQSKGLLFHRTS
jgi:hypothetical protein